jgi:hypothetical protein
MPLAEPCVAGSLKHMEIPWIDLLNASASVATAAGVFIAVWQIKLQIRQQVTDFEDDLDREYREIALSLPIEALLGETLPAQKQEDSLEQFHRYFDLSNQQVFLRQVGRITDPRWSTWVDEIQINLAKPAFRSAWEEIKSRAPGEFTLLRRLESTAFDTDPMDW